MIATMNGYSYSDLTSFESSSSKSSSSSSSSAAPLSSSSSLTTSLHLQQQFVSCNLPRQQSQSQSQSQLLQTPSLPKQAPAMAIQNDKRLSSSTNFSFTNQQPQQQQQPHQTSSSSSTTTTIQHNNNEYTTTTTSSSSSSNLVGLVRKKLVLQDEADGGMIGRTSCRSRSRTTNNMYQQQVLWDVHNQYNDNNYSNDDTMETEETTNSTGTSASTTTNLMKHLSQSSHQHYLPQHEMSISSSLAATGPVVTSLIPPPGISNHLITTTTPTNTNATSTATIKCSSLTSSSGTTRTATTSSSSSGILRALRGAKNSLHSQLQHQHQQQQQTTPFVPTAAALQRDESETAEETRRARHEMIELLENRLRVKCHSQNNTNPASNNDNINNNTNNDPEQIPKTARILEQLLFKQANQNLKLYLDKSTLDSRLRSLMTILVRRKMMMQQSTPSSSSSASSSSLASSSTTTTTSIITTTKDMFESPMSALSASYAKRKQQTTTATTSTSTSTLTPSYNNRKQKRHLLLQRLLGRDRYHHIRDVVRQIQIAKMKKVAQFKCGFGPCNIDVDNNNNNNDNNNNNNVVVCGGGGGRMFVGENLPCVIRRLYFETTLVQAFESFDMKRLQSTSMDCWDSWLEQAQRNLKDFETWEKNW